MREVVEQGGATLVVLAVVAMAVQIVVLDYRDLQILEAAGVEEVLLTLTLRQVEMAVRVLLCFPDPLPTLHMG